MCKTNILIKFCLPFLVTFCYQGWVRCQNISQTIALAETLFSEGNYQKAANEYRRAYFFSPGSDKYSLAGKIADCYMAERNFPLAKMFCDSASVYAPNDSALAEGCLKETTCLILENNVGDAVLKLENISYSFNKHVENKRNLLLGLAYIELDDYDKAYAYLANTINNDPAKLAQLQDLVEGYKELDKPNPWLASGMSAIVPGSGQVYTSNYFNGVNSFFLIAGLVYLGYNLQPLSMIIIPIVSRYYWGGISKAYHYAEEKRIMQKVNFTDKLLKVLPVNGMFKRDVPSKNDFTPFLKHVLDSDSEVPIMVSTSFLLYKKLISSQDVDACVFTPSCSVYMMGTIRKNGLLKGLLDGTDRLLRCHALADHAHYKTFKLTGKLHDEP
ncbi:MAG TPA: membrane protein insertion efficiency factor YidD [Paludibacter sp.]|nr:membrane protein insertion efficiency factor YidD [Paludibacter sp.]